MKRWGISSRVLFAALVPAALIAIALAWFFTYARIGDLERELQERGAAIARQIAPACEYGLFSGNRDFLAQLAESATREADVTGVAIVNEVRELLARRGALSERVPWDIPVPQGAALVFDVPGGLVFVAPVLRFQARTDELFGPSQARPGGPGPNTILGAVMVQVSRASAEQRKRELILNAALITLAGLILASWLARQLSRGVTEPVLTLAQTVAEIERGNLAARARIEAGGVLGVLAGGINDMAGALEDARLHLEKRIADATAELQAQKEVAEQANRTKTQFLAAASHDLRQPIQAVGLFVSALRLRSRDEDTQKYVSRIERALSGLETVLDGLLDISRLDAGVVTPRIEDFPLANLFAGLRDTFAGTAAEARLRLDFVDTRAWCRSDPLLLERILSNLVSNALRYTHHGGVCVGVRRRAGVLHVEVWDTGIGIPADKQEQVFQEFVQLGNPHRQRDKGLGLGLAIVQRLGRLLEHPISLRSVSGRGTVFSVAVPRAARRAVAIQREAAWSGRHSFDGLHVLFIDDDADVLEAIRTFLTQLGARVLTAQTYALARAAIAESSARPDVLLSDYRLAGALDGVEVIQALRAEFGAGIPAAIITGEAAEAVLQRVADAGLPLLHKPVRAEVLEALLADLLGRIGDQP
jgi:signal transduction histidine kinase/CheY-like chemotaxis protein